MSPLVIPIAMMLAGTAINARAQRKAADRMDREMALQSLRQTELTDQQRASVLENLRSYDPYKRDAAQTAEATQAEAALKSAVQDAAAYTAPTAPSATGRISKDFTEGRAEAIRRAANRASALAGLLAKFRAPTQLRAEEALTNANFASDEANLAARLRDRTRTGEQLVARAGRVDPLATAVGSGLQMAGSSMASGQIMKGLTGGAGAYPGMNEHLLTQSTSAQGLMG